MIFMTFIGFVDQFFNIGFSYLIDWLLSVNPHFI